MRAVQVSRRAFVGAVTAVAAAGCAADQSSDGSADQKRTDPGAGGAGGSGQDVPQPGQYQESPMLAAKVQAGELPPVRDRLPKRPYVVRQGDLVDGDYLEFQPGKYGGTLELPQESPNADPHIQFGTVESLLWAPGAYGFAKGHPITGNVLAGCEVNGDNAVFTFHLRDGLRWSDGELVTIEDVRFAFTDVLGNSTIMPAFPAYLRTGGTSKGAPARLTVVDDLTFSLTFDAPYGSFTPQITIGWALGYGDVIKPLHRLRQFHEKYASKSKLAELVKAASLPEGQWQDLFNAQQMHGYSSIADERFREHPTLTPWVMVQARNGLSTFERNPYYFKIDTAGNQLPYIDRFRAQLVKDKETVTSRALFGEFDYAGDRMSMRKISLVAEKADKGEVTMFVPLHFRLPMNYVLNLTHPDPVWRKVVRDVRFRRALSLAIDRAEIVEVFFLGEFARRSTETNRDIYDVAEANRLLDEMGMTNRDGDGYRLGPDGKPFRIPFDLYVYSEDVTPMCELIADHWKEVGVLATVRAAEVSDWARRLEANQLKATGWTAHNDVWRYAIATEDCLPQTFWGPLWTLWYNTDGRDGEEPPPEVRELFSLREQLMASPVGSEPFDAAVEGILKSHRENIWNFNPVEHTYYPTFWHKRIKNVPQGIKKDTFGMVVNNSMEQWYIDE